MQKLYPRKHYQQTIKYHRGKITEIYFEEHDVDISWEELKFRSPFNLIFKYISDDGKNFKNYLQSSEGNNLPTIFD